MKGKLASLLVLGLIGSAPLTFAGAPIDDGANDENLSAAARRALDAWESPADTEVAVSVSNGTATLTGGVALLRDSWLADEVVAGVPGIRRIDNQLKVQTDDRDDLQIRDDLRQLVASDPELASTGVSVDVVDGQAVFTGTVGDARLRFVARKIAGGTRGVVAFEDRLECSKQATDDEIEREATGLLKPGALTGSLGLIGIDVSSGSVTLTGAVQTLAARRLAEERVRGINGVRAVNNEIRVEPSSP